MAIEIPRAAPGRPSVGAAPSRAWRRVHRHIWLVETCHGRVGVVLAGLRFAVIDGEGRIVGRCWSLRSAQRLAQHSADRLEWISGAGRSTG